MPHHNRFRDCRLNLVCAAPCGKNFGDRPLLENRLTVLALGRAATIPVRICITLDSRGGEVASAKVEAVQVTLLIACIDVINRAITIGIDGPWTAQSIRLCGGIRAIASCQFYKIIFIVVASRSRRELVTEARVWVAPDAVAAFVNQ